MKSFLIIGMSTFGQHLCKELSQRNSQVMIVDKNEELVERMLPFAVSGKIADCTNGEVLASFGVDEFDTCFVCVGGHFTESLEITSMLREMGAQKIISEVNRDIEAKFLLRNGADSVVYPEKDLAYRIASAEADDSIFDEISLSDGYSVFEIRVPKAWCGKTIKEIDVRAKYKLSIIATKSNNHLQPMLDPSHVFSKDEHLLVMGHTEDIKKVIK